MADSETLTLDPANKVVLDVQEQIGRQTLGIMTNQAWHHDPRRLSFTLSRYKFISKLFSGKQNVLEVGCGDAFGTRIVLQEVENLTAIDIDPLFIHDVKSRMTRDWEFKALQHDILSGPMTGSKFDAIYSLDVLEHIFPLDEEKFVKNIIDSATPHAAVIIGMPSLESQQYASPPSKAGHVNCKSGREFKLFMERFFHNVFIFSMNDEVVHTGYYPMAQYLFAVCSDIK